MVKDVKVVTRRTTMTAGSQQLVLWSLNPMNGRLDPSSVCTGSSVRNYASIAFSMDYESLYAALTAVMSCIGIKHLSLELTSQPAKLVSSIAVGQKVCLCAYFPDVKSFFHNVFCTVHHCEGRRACEQHLLPPLNSYIYVTLLPAL